MEGNGRHAASSGDVSRHGKTMAYVDVGRGKCCGSGVKESAKVSETVGARREKADGVDLDFLLLGIKDLRK